MFCPYCGSKLKMLENGKAQCEASGASLSMPMARRLEHFFCGATQGGDEEPFPSELGGTWHCPKCSVQMVEEGPGQVACRKCGKRINEFVRELIESNPHP